MRIIFFALLSFFVLVPAASAKSPIINYKTRFIPTISENGMVVAAEKLASEVGVDILERGGNVVDAAVATGFALAVTYPRAGNLAGGGFMLVHLARENKQIVIDYRESAPLAAKRDMYLDAKGEVDRMRSFASHQAAGVPGTVAGLVYALEKYGTMSLKEVLKPAIKLAHKGFPVSYALAFEISGRANYLPWHESSRPLFFKPDGSAYAAGEHFTQPELAWTLRQIAKKGAHAFYKGTIAEKIIADMEANNGLITREDLAGYKVVERTPVRGSYRDYEIVATPAPSSGGLNIIQILNILEGYDLASLGHNSAAYLHRLTESMKLAYADRSKYLGDPDFSKVPVAQLLDKKYAAHLRKSIDIDKARPAAEIAPGLDVPYESTDTTHYSIMDKDGNVASNTYTLNFSFGSGIAVPGTGMLLNNEMADFSAKPGAANPFGLVGGAANEIEPGKRPLSSMTPTLVLKDGKAWLTTGSPGGSRIITTVLQLLLNAMDFDMNVASAAAAARIHSQWLPDKVIVESGVSPDTVKLLEGMGHGAVRGDRTLGRTQSIMLQDGLLYGATDTRRPGGSVAGY
ncbi:MAG: gamma-glutamyltransferase [Pseudomonadales bacterium]